VRGRLSGRPRHFLTRRWLDPAEPLARAWARPGQPLVWPGQFIFGLPTQDDHQPLVPGPPRPAPGWARNGSLLVFRHLRQDVPAFRRFTAEAVDALRATEGFADVDQARLEAALVGRWPEGTALARDERPPEADAARDMQAINHFGFRADAPALRVCADPKVAQEGLAAAARGDELREVAGTAGDPDGRRCPRFAHVRKVNPRDLPTDQGDPDRTLAFQMLRRGITWGAPYSEEEPAVAGDRGLLFMSWQSSIDEQFELLTTRWMNRGQGPEGNSGHDLLVGQARKREAVLPGPGGRTARLSTDVRWVVPTGGGYFFGPSLGTLAALAA
jgi:Dyp-type peroxidase family